MSRLLQTDPALRDLSPALVDALVPVYVAETEEEREAVFASRYAVYCEEIGYKGVSGDDVSHRAHDAEDDKPYTTLVYTVDGTGSLTGTCRIRHWQPGQVPPEDWQALSMSMFDGIEDLATCEIERLAVLPEHRGGVVPVSIVYALYQLIVHLGVDVTFTCCPPGLVRYYRAIGYLPYAGRLVPTAEGMMVPLVSFPSNRSYLERAGSVLTPFVDGYYGAGKRAVLDVSRWAHVLDQDAAPVSFDAAASTRLVASLRNLSTEQASMLQALSEETARILAEKGFVLTLSAGQPLIEKGLAQQEVFVILDGAFEVWDDDRWLRTMGPGDVIGEIAFFGTAGRRSATVKAASNGQVLVLRRRFVEELIESDPARAAEILFQLARVLADRRND